MPARRAWAAIERSGMREEIERCTFESFVANSEWQEHVLAQAKAYVAKVLNGSKGWFVILGQSGSGKTHLSSAICGDLLRARKQVKYSKWREVLLKAKNRFSDSDPDGDNSDYIESLKEVEILYIDD